MSDFKSSDPFWGTQFPKPSNDFPSPSIPSFVYIFFVIFVLFIILGVALSCYFQRKQRETQRELAAQGYSIGVVNVNGHSGFIAIPPQQPTVVTVQQPPPLGVQPPPPYNPNCSSGVNFPNTPVYSAMPNQRKY